ncbi:MAG: NAD/NADP octopine/nopaline dehydrogenase family protein [Candidatus Hodarchaeota archaeon]
MKKYKVAVLGNNSTALAIVAYLRKNGHTVNLWHDSIEGIEDAISSGEITAEGAVEGRFKLNLVTNKIFLAVKDVEIILISLPGTEHASIARKLVPHLENYQVVLLVPGFTWGAMIASNIIKAEQPELDIYVGETQTSLFTASITSDSCVRIPAIHEKGRFCFFPPVDNMHVDYMISGLFPGIIVKDDIRITSLLCLDAMLYPPVALVNLGSWDLEGGVTLFKDGITPDVVKIVKKIDEERLDLIELLGMKRKPITEWFEESLDIKNCDYYSMFEALERLDPRRFSSGGLKNRVVEEIECGLIPLKSIAIHLGRSTPTIDSILNIASTACEKDFMQSGRTIESVQVPPELLAKRSPRKVKMEKIPLDSFVDKMCKQILDDFKEGWIFIQASREILNIVKELIHETTGRPINPENWRQYFSSEKKSRIIAVVKKTEYLKTAFEMGDEFEEFFGVILDLKDGNLTAKPVLFYNKSEKEAKDFIKNLKEEVHEFLDKIIEEEFKAKGREIILEDMEFEE